MDTVVLMLGVELETQESRLLRIVPIGLRQFRGAGAGVDPFQQRHVIRGHRPQPQAGRQLEPGAAGRRPHVKTAS